MGFELARIGLAFIGVLICTYYDLFNRRNVPNILLYAFLGISLLVAAVDFNAQNALFVFGVATAVFAIGYLVLYRTGMMGGADIYILAAIALLLPYAPSTVAFSGTVYYPFIVSVIIASGVSFMVYEVVKNMPLAARAVASGKFKLQASKVFQAGAVLLAYVFLYSTAGTLGIFPPAYFAFVSFLVFVSLFFLFFKEIVNESMAEAVAHSKIEEEDILAVEMMDAADVKKYKLQRLMDAAELKRTAKFPIKKWMVYKHLPCFTPHILIGLLFSVFVGDAMVVLMALTF
jgi:Flp pilus assembly protein protease CpaA